VKLYFEKIHKKSDLETLEKGHGRIEKREYLLETDIGWLEQRDDWKGFTGIGAVRSAVEEKGVVREETRYFILAARCQILCKRCSQPLGR